MLANNTAVFRLSAEGKEALKDLPLDGDLVKAFVVAEDEVGAWIIAEQAAGMDYPVRLLKWEHFLTAMLELPPEQAPEARRAIGFRKNNRERES
jgi:hypothetical protein